MSTILLTINFALVAYGLYASNQANKSIEALTNKCNALEDKVEAATVKLLQAGMREKLKHPQPAYTVGTEFKDNPFNK